ncbi:MAG TPA: low temperature requirement protein A [Solirubrobacteraceae bacterium]|nr:low temperature requirement protein A [Solirubrobacteraceae bacterium]
MATTATSRPRRMSATLREEARVTPLELFFDLVFVLALTQCTALMADQPTWEGLAKGMLVLAVMWWAWVGYAWLTSVIDPEEGAVRLVFFAAMAGLLIVALCVPGAFHDEALLFAGAYGVVRIAHLALFFLACRDDPVLRRAVFTGLTVSTSVAIGLLVVASFLDGIPQGAVWALAIAIDMSGPLFHGQDGWRLVPGHFAERHGLILIIALGESIVAIGIGAEGGVTTGVVIAAAFGVMVAAALWWLYFDVVALVAERRLANAEAGRERNTIARDSFSYLHLPMVAGIVLLALGLKKTLEHVEDPLKLVPAVALLGGTALYLLAHVAFRYRNVHSFNWHRTVTALLLVALIPVAVEIPALAIVIALAAILALLIAYEVRRYGEARDRLRHQLAHE